MSNDTNTSKTASQEAREMGQALKLLRSRRGLTQDQAAEQMAVTRTAWQNYEGGRAIVLRTDMQAKLAKALGASRADLLACLRDVQQGPDHSSSSPNVGVVLAGPGRQQAIFPTGDGDVILNYPAEITAEGRRQLRAYLDIFLSRDN